MLALQRVLVGVGFAKGTSWYRLRKGYWLVAALQRILVGDGLSGAHKIILPPKAYEGQGM